MISRIVLASNYFPDCIRIVACTVFSLSVVNFSYKRRRRLAPRSASIDIYEATVIVVTICGDPQRHENEEP